MTNASSPQCQQPGIRRVRRLLVTSFRAGVSPKIVSERIGHANVGFFLETYAHVLGNDDREAAEQAAGFLIGDVWSDDERSQA
jgi:hypothetical protein